MPQSYREREDVYDVAPEFVMPPLDSLVPAGGTLERETLQLVSHYVDTTSRDLLAAGVTLRRRTGDADTGWQLKVPAGAARTELRLPLTGSEQAPAALADVVRGIACGQPLLAVAEIRTTRQACRILNPDASVLVEIVDDQVHATAFGAAVVISEWRELEAELGTGDEKLLKRVRKVLGAAGAQPAADSSKLSRALSSPPVPSAHPISDYLRAQHAELLSGDLVLRRGHDVGGSIHHTRVATRRTRSTLRVFAGAFDSELAEHLDVELAWYAGLLGAVRDLDVLRRHFDIELDGLDDSLALGPVRRYVHAQLGQDHRQREDELRAAMTSERYFALLAALARWVPEPLANPAAAKPSAVRAAVSKARRKAARRVEHALTLAADGDDAVVAAALHRARKATKRARYAVELAAPTGSPAHAKRVVKDYKRLQDLLGRHQDGVVATEVLRRYGAAAGVLPDHNGFTYGLLYERELAGMRRARARVAELASRS